MTCAAMKALPGAALIVFSMAVTATVITGRLDDPHNPALVGSDLGALGVAAIATTFVDSNDAQAFSTGLNDLWRNACPLLRWHALA